VPLCVYIHMYMSHTDIHTYFKSSNSASLPILHTTCSSYQMHTKVDNVQSQRWLPLGTANSECRRSVPTPCQACDLSWRDAAGDSELSLLSTSPAHSPPPQQIGTLPQLLSCRYTILFSSLLSSDFLVSSGSSPLSFTAHP